MYLLLAFSVSRPDDGCLDNRWVVLMNITFIFLLMYIIDQRVPITTSRKKYLNNYQN